MIMPIRTSLKIVTSCIVLLVTSLQACADSPPEIAETKVIVESDLQHHRWLLDSINGEALPQDHAEDKIPELDFGEQMHVSGSTGCNRYNGKAVLRDGYFQIESMASTRRMCAPPADELERLFITMLGQDSRISIDGDRNLILESGKTVLIFRLRDWVR